MIFRYMLLGAIQGLTEFLPVSSSGHLVILHRLLGVAEGKVSFDIIVHLASFCAVIFFCRRQVRAIIRAILMRINAFIKHKPLESDADSVASLKIGLFILYASIVTAIIGITCSNFFEAMFSSLKAVAVFLIITGIVLFLTKFKQESSQRREEGLKIWDGLFVGLAQGLSLAPGLSRSGMTIACAVFKGIKPRIAVRLSFLLSIPAIIGAAFFKIKEIVYIDIAFKYLFVAFLSALVFSFLALKILVAFVVKYKLHYFAYYCWGLSVLIFFIAKKGI